MPKCKYSIHRVKDHRVLKHAIVVKLAQVSNLGNPPLVELEVVLLKAKGDGLQNATDNPDHKGRVMPIQRSQQDG